MSDIVVVDIDSRIATITLNRPKQRNAISAELLTALREAVAAAQADDAVDVLILTGSDPAFCAGLDLKELADGNGLLASSTGADSDTPAAQRGPFPTGPKPLIGAINGAAITGGFELALACDFLIASDRARFADTHARVGIQPWWGLTVRLPQAIGVRRARQMSATGNFCDAQTALEWGLVNQVVAHEELHAVTRALAADIVSNDQAAVRRIFATYAEGALVPGEQAWRIESDVAEGWLARGLDADDVERRRAQVTDRGRGQLS
ncbi:enoyl-CoA hydratase [Millisia brevis]|uniref:enoyl-CoA hydratase n=1 Tax=Millisia brevis TaxID=264148 RepID=UPI00082A1971|nr:enoyl-CoA hydratase [Millisia brevis]